MHNCSQKEYCNISCFKECYDKIFGTKVTIPYNSSKYRLIMWYTVHKL